MNAGKAETKNNIFFHYLTKSLLKQGPVLAVLAIVADAAEVDAALY